ncbi:MAG: enoyl-CoA hydratase/isomerase family protein [Planctomycetota bacterium]
MIQREDRDGVAVLQLAHGKVNAMDVVLLESLNRMLQELEESPARALVVTGSGSIFCAGVDLFKVLDGGPSYLQVFLPVLKETLERVFFYPKPLVAAINGHAIAGGCILACACDARFMSDGPGKIGAPELRVGVPFPALGLEMLRFALPPQYFQEVIYLGRSYAPQQALERGIIDEIVQQNELLEKACQAANELAALPPVAFRHTKEQLRQPVRDFLTAHAGRIDPEVEKIWSAPETLGRMRDYVEKTIQQSE